MCYSKNSELFMSIMHVKTSHFAARTCENRANLRRVSIPTNTHRVVPNYDDTIIQRSRN